MPKNAFRPGDLDRAAVGDDYFALNLKAIAEPIDPRTEKELLRDASGHDDPAVREHAIYEYIYRNEHDAFATVLSLWEGETEPAVRVSIFEELARLDRSGFKKYLEHKKVPRDVEFVAQAQYDAKVPKSRRKQDLVKSDKKETFDQTLPLRVALREYIEVEPNRWMYHVFSPLQEQRVAGQLLACTRVDTRMNRMVLTKQLPGLHKDGSLHLENTLFVGRTAMVNDTRGVFSFRTLLNIPFYPSGRIGDKSEGIVRDADIMVARAGTWNLDPDIQVRGRPTIQNVTGIIHAWGYTRPDKATFDPGGRMDLIAGLFHLGDLIDPRTRDYINSYTIGSYRGVVMPDDEGRLGLNVLPSYATLDGEIDRDRTGKADVEGVHFDECPGVHPISHYTGKKSLPQPRLEGLSAPTKGRRATKKGRKTTKKSGKR